MTAIKQSKYSIPSDASEGVSVYFDDSELAELRKLLGYRESDGFIPSPRLLNEIVTALRQSRGGGTVTLGRELDDIREITKVAQNTDPQRVIQGLLDLARLEYQANGPLLVTKAK